EVEDNPHRRIRWPGRKPRWLLLRCRRAGRGSLHSADISTRKGNLGDHTDFEPARLIPAFDTHASIMQRGSPLFSELSPVIGYHYLHALPNYFGRVPRSTLHWGSSILAGLRRKVGVRNAP